MPAKDRSCADPKEERDTEAGHGQVPTWQQGQGEAGKVERNGSGATTGPPRALGVVERQQGNAGHAEPDAGQRHPPVVIVSLGRLHLPDRPGYAAGSPERRQGKPEGDRAACHHDRVERRDGALVCGEGSAPAAPDTG